MPNARTAGLLALTIALAAARPDSMPPSPPLPVPGPLGWGSAVDNPYLPLAPGRVMAYVTRGAGGAGTDTLEVLRGTKRVLGAQAVVVRDREYRGNDLVEESSDWYAQDRTGNVWYLGEDTREYKGGRVVSTSGSWEAGKYGAIPGIVMWAHPVPGKVYRQEYRRGSSEDIARVLDVHAVAAAAGVTYEDCVQTEEWSPLERGLRQHKFYAKGVGLVRMQSAEGPSEEMTLVGVSGR